MSADDDALRDLIERAQQSVSKNGHTTNSNSHPPEPPPVDNVPAIDYGRWRLEAGYVIKRALDNVPEEQRPMIASMEQNRLVDLVVKQAREIIDEKKPPWYPLPPELSETDIDEELHGLATRAIEVFRDVYLPAEQSEPQTYGEIILVEKAQEATVSNAEYLSRAPIVDRLYYTRHISITVGGKHEGKSTITRTEALAIASGFPVYDRATMQTPVIYVASDDEYATTRMELLRMGWNSSIPLTLARVSYKSQADPEKVLDQIARLATSEGAKYIVLDMLFDFIRVQDENKYAQTRTAIGLIQNLADTIEGHVKATHHSPKWMPDAAKAAQAALGSQGIAARFSPILLARKWADTLYTIQSTNIRDPRGEAIATTCVVRDENGWARMNGIFKAFMKWVMYSDRIMGLFEGGDDKLMSVAQVAEALDISKHEAGNALLQMNKNQMLDRRKSGKHNSYLYSIPRPGLFDQNSSQ